MNVVRCANPDCPDPYGGRITNGMVRPARMSAERFGLDGKVCHLCYTRLVTRQQTIQRRRETGHSRLSAVDRDGLGASVQQRGWVSRPPPDPERRRAGVAEAESEIEKARRIAHQHRGQGQPRRPCPANPLGGHRLIQPAGMGVYAPFTCDDCGWVFVPPDPLIEKDAAA